MKVRFIVSGLMLANLLLVWLAGSGVSAQDSESCAALAEDVLESVAEICSALATNTVCAGTGPVALSTHSLENSDFVPGETVPLRDVLSLSTGHRQDASRGIALVNIQAGLPDNALQMILFGNSEMTNLIEAMDGGLPTMPLKNSAGYGINLRKGPGTNFTVSGTLAEDSDAVATGRDPSGQWYRLQYEAGSAWVHESLVDVEGDAESLAVVDNLYSEPMQAFNLRAGGDESCGVSNSGLLIHQAGASAAQIRVNGVDLSFGPATLLLQSNPAEAELQIQVIDGSVSVGVQNRTEVAETGQAVRVALTAGETLSPISQPKIDPQYSFTSVGGAPLSLLDSNNLVCVAGVGAGDPLPSIFFGPGETYGAASDLDAGGHYPILGYATDANDQLWWQVQAGHGQSWLSDATIRTTGLCSAVAAVNPPPLVVSTSGSSTSSSASFLPAGQSVWQAESGADVMTGSCSGPPLAICSHPAAIIPNDDGTVYWRGQEPVPYLMTPTGPNSFAHTGRNFQGNGNVGLELTLTGENTWSMTFSTVFDNDAQCTHTFYYTATRKW